MPKPKFIWTESAKNAAAKWLFKCANHYEFKPLKFDLSKVDFWDDGTAHLSAPAHNHTHQYARFDEQSKVWELC